MFGNIRYCIFANLHRLGMEDKVINECLVHSVIDSDSNNNAEMKFSVILQFKVLQVVGIFHADKKPKSKFAQQNTALCYV